MRKLLLLLTLTVAFASCDKEVVDSRYKADFGETQDWDDQTEVVLAEGISDASIKVNMRRRSFRSYVPKDLPETGVPIVFCFHGNLPYLPDNPYNPVGGFNEYDMLAVLAERDKFIVCHPVGSVVDDLGVLGWNDQEQNAIFFDKLIEYFKSGCKGLDVNRVYVTGVSSGAIFSFGLAYLRPEKVAASVPVSGQYTFGTNFVKPSRVVPIRTYTGTEDDAVDCEAAYNNMMSWVVNVAEGNQDDNTVENIVISGRLSYDVEVTKWNTKADYEFYKVLGADHSIDLQTIYPSMWDFMKAHSLK